jgi:hypothetical protein
MIYLCAGIYAEGPTDEAFLCKLVDRLLHNIAHDVCPGQFTIEDTRAIQEPRALLWKRDRATRIAAAIDYAWEPCNVFVIHGDADGNREKAFEERIRPGIERARETHPDLAAAACIPVQETEAWMLADPDAFQKIFERPVSEPLPHDVDSLRDPKTCLENTLRTMGVSAGRAFDGYDALLGDHVCFDSLQRLSAFRQFESNLRAAVELHVNHMPA